MGDSESTQRGDKVRAEGVAVPLRGTKAKAGEMLNILTHGELVGGQAYEDITRGEIVRFDQDGKLRVVRRTYA